MLQNQSHGPMTHSFPGWRHHGCTRWWPARCLLCCLLIVPQLGLTETLWSERAATEKTLPALQQFNDALTQLTATLLPAVVSLKVQIKKEAETPPAKSHRRLSDDDLPVVTGSGFIIRADGLALTSYHVIEESVSIEVHLHDGETTTATVLGRDPLGDVALLQLATQRPLPVLPLGNSTAVRLGEFVVAIGSPFGFEHTITLGIISGKKRQFLRAGVLGGFLQTDAPLTVGNSGGPLVNMRGEVLGINTAIVGRGEVGLAVPIDAVKELLPQLHAAGSVLRAWLGVQLRPLNRSRAQGLGLEAPHGAYVHEVLPHQPAHQAGIAVGDVIVSFDGKAVQTPGDLQGAVAATPVGKKVRVELVRARHRRTVEVALGKMPPAKE